MEECLTPEIQQTDEFTYNNDEFTPAEQLNHLTVKKIDTRCFTPTVQDFQSPGLSPINALMQNGAVAAPLVLINFKKPNDVTTEHSYNKTPQQQQQQQEQQQQQQEEVQQQQSSTYSPSNGESSDSPSNGESSDSPLNEESSNSISKSENENGLQSSSFFNHTLNVYSVLKHVGLEEYTETFTNAGIDFQKFLNIKPNDLQKIGVNSDKDCKIIMELLRELNT